MTDEKFTINHAIHNADEIRLQGLKLGADEVTINLSRVHAQKVVPLVLKKVEWHEVQFGMFKGERVYAEYDFHCPNTGMIFATYFDRKDGDSFLVINHNAN